MTICAFFLGGAVALALFAIGLGKFIKFGNEIDEHALPWEPPAQPYTNNSTLVQVSRSGLIIDSEM